MDYHALITKLVFFFKVEIEDYKQNIIPRRLFRVGSEALPQIGKMRFGSCAFHPSPTPGPRLYIGSDPYSGGNIGLNCLLLFYIVNKCWY